VDLLTEGAGGDATVLESHVGFLFRVVVRVCGWDCASAEDGVNGGVGAEDQLEELVHGVTGER
jgi:hypothetical protein